MLPVIYFNSKILFLDDEKSFFDSLSLYLTDLPFKTQHFLDSASLLTYLEGQHAFDIHSIIKQNNLDTGYEYNLQSQDLFNINKIAFDKSKEQVVSTIVIDYHLQGENGLEVAAKLKKYGCEVILLTGHSDTSTAISAFNQGLIDFYIQKYEPDFATTLRKTLFKAETNFFNRKSIAILESLKILNPDCLLFNPDFQSFFNELRIEKNIKEFYLFDSIGSFLCLSNDHTCSILFITLDIENKLLLEIAEIEDAPQSLINSLKDNTNMLCYFNSDNFHLPDINQWSQNLKNAKIQTFGTQLCKHRFEEKIHYIN
jgi:FixJ family two-component response regulator